MGRKDKKIKELNTTNEDRYIEEDEDVETIEDIKNKEKEERKEVRKEKRGKIKRTFSLYKFFVKIVAFALLVTLGIFTLVKNDEAVGMIYMVCGIIIAGFALIRLIPLFKTLKHHRSRIVAAVEIVLHFLIGSYLIISAFICWQVISASDANEISGLKGWDQFNLKFFTYLIVITLWSRALCHFWLVDLYQEASNKVNFWVHAVCMTAAVALGILAQNVDTKVIVIVLAVMCLISAVVIGGEAVGGYVLYRREIAQNTPKKEKTENKGLELPNRDEKDITDIDPNIIRKDDNDQDSAIVS